MTKNILFAFFLTFLACSQADNTEDEYLIFGRFNGFCRSNCTDIYKMENGNIYADLLDQAIIDQLSFSDKPLGQDKYDTAKSLLPNIPKELEDLSPMTLGCPDCYDQGTYIVEFRRSTGLKRFLIDPDLDVKKYPETVRYLTAIDAVLESFTQ